MQTQEVAKAYGAVWTPDFYLFKKDRRRPFELVYHGWFDNSRPRSNTPITGRDIREALDCTISGRPVSGSQKPSIGCSIKWAPASRNYWHCQELLLQLPVSQDTCVLPVLSFPQDWGSLWMVLELILGTSYDISVRVVFTGSGFLKIYACHMVTLGSEQVNSRVS